MNRAESSAPPVPLEPGDDPGLSRRGLGRRGLSRRAFLGRLAAVGGVAAGGAALGAWALADGSSPIGPIARSGPGSGSGSGAGSGLARGSGQDEGPMGRLLPGAVDDRLLVVVDLQGGNDGLSTLVPYGSGRYHDLRPDLAVPDEDVLALDDEVGLHPSLARLHRRGVTTVEGVGPVDGDLSHFGMAARWQRGDVDGTWTQARTGFLGRLTDAVDDGSPLVGVSIGGTSPHLTNRSAGTMAISDSNHLWPVQPTDWSELAAFQDRLGRFDRGTGGSADLVGSAAHSYRQLLDIGREIGGDGEGIDWEHPMVVDGGDVGWKLYVAADLLAAGVGTRVVTIGTGDFDTHSGHRWRQEAMLAELDAGVDGFLTRADELGFGDRVVVATVSEFGRRVPENGDGLDHGVASTMLVAGAGVGDRRAGERPPLDDLDEGDNLRTMVGFDRYLAALAEGWLGVEAASVLPNDPTPLDLF